MHVVVLYEVTTAVNTAVDSGILNLVGKGPIDAILVEVYPSGAMTTANLDLIDPDAGATQLARFATGTGTGPVTVGWGLGVGGAAVGTGQYLGGIPAPLSPKVQVKCASLGAAVTNHLRVIGVCSGK